MTRIDVGLWSECCEGADLNGRRALFLDRDGVVVEEADFLCRPEDMRLTPRIAGAISRVNQLNVPVILVTNQSGIARGFFEWSHFETVQAALSEALAREGARLDAVFACGYHIGGRGDLGIADHPWRKPNPGMLQAAAARFDIVLSSSWIIGDRVSDLEAGHRAGLAGGSLVSTGYGLGQVDAFEARLPDWTTGGFAADLTSDAANAIAAVLERWAGLKRP